MKQLTFEDLRYNQGKEDQKSGIMAQATDNDYIYGFMNGLANASTEIWNGPQGNSLGLRKVRSDGTIIF